MTNKNIQNITHFGLILMILICVYFFSQGYFTNPQLLQATLSKAGILAPLLFIFLQIIQVIIPIVPGGASSALGITAFGAVNGFIYNYIGIALFIYCSIACLKHGCIDFFISIFYFCSLLRPLFFYNSGCRLSIIWLFTVQRYGGSVRYQTPGDALFG